ncbi:MAG: flagellar hook-associated protein FlgK [Oscillospiraceae bacterium]
MRSTFVGFETARRGIMASQKAIDVTGNNLANINTPGYTRQRLDLVSVNTFGSGDRLATSQYDKTGQGVGMNGVAQVRDSFLDKRFREEYCDVGYYDQSVVILKDIENALDEQVNTGMKDALSNFMKSIQSLNNASDQEENANIVLTSAKTVTQVLKQLYRKLDEIGEQQKYELGIAEKNVNSVLMQLAELNKTISKDISISSNGNLHNQTYGPNELLDKQNMLLDQLSMYADINVTRNADHTVSVELAGKTAVSGGDYSQIGVVNNSDGKTVSIVWADTGKDIALTTGELKAFTDFINGNGIHAAETITKSDSLEKGVLYYKTKLDVFAKTFADKMNNILPIKDENGKDTGEFKQLFVVGDEYPMMGATSITVNPEWEKRPGYIIKDIVVDGQLDNSYISKMINVFTAKDHDFGEFQGSFEEYINFYNLSVGEQIKSFTGRLNSSVEIADSVLDSRDQISGVSQDEEGVNLMLHQKSFQAASRLMTVLDEALDLIINRMGTVGR